jgi:hypothetical protein
VRKGRPEKERKEGQSFSEKKKSSPPCCKKGAKATTTTKFRKERKKAVGCPTKYKATPRLDSVFKNSVTHSFFSREAHNDLL